ncbi:PREDICTED: prostaglandin reductase-3-like isoform X1 [Branchiostoma belcheri]|uniref:15-oxoprostaglandin 13-reductase n=2 Tax=Branchiostoma belcheri TaxID=7741 RepID=A0A6P5AWA7_BRABE|nr:PREDICTED: prostaglandin reductase-3-like isoform X1 [Branchiostoma belcheri]
MSDSGDTEHNQIKMAAHLPKAFKRIMVSSLTPKFRSAISIETVPMATPGPKEVLVKNRFVGINASDVNFAAGRYDPTKVPPFQIGFEGLGVVAAAGAESNFKVGQPIAYLYDGAFSEYKVLPSKFAIPIPSLKPEYIPLMVSGLTAAISFDEVGDLKKGETVLVTAAAGGTGQFAVQLAKKAGCHVIGTCSTDAKMEFLKSIGCDRPINYKQEDLNEVLKTEYPRGVDVVYESVGAQMFDTCVNRLAVKGRLIVIGFITGYKSDTGYTPIRGGATLPPKLLTKSASVRGFFLFHYTNLWVPYLQRLVSMYQAGDLMSQVDRGEGSGTGVFNKGVQSIPDAVEYLYTGQSKGKIIVEFPEGSSKL